MVTECHAGQVYLLDYTKMGLIVPEMVKERLVVVVSPRLINIKRGLATVIPLSISAPRSKENHVVPLSKDYEWIKGKPKLWAKTDMIYTPSFDCLSYVERVARNEGLPRNHNPVPQISQIDLKHIRLGIAHAVGLEDYLVNDEKKGFSRFMTDRYRSLLKRVTSLGKKSPH